MKICNLQSTLEVLINNITNKIDSSKHNLELNTNAQVSSLMNLECNSLIPKLKEIPELEIFNKKMRAFASGWGLVDYSSLAYSLVYRALEVGASQTIDELDLYVSSNEFNVQQMQLLGGLNLSEEILLSNEISVIPFQPWVNENHKLIVTDDGNTETINRISAAIVKKYRHPKVHKASKDPDYNSQPIMPELWDFSELDDVLLCISLIGPSGPAMLATSIYPSQWIPTSGGPIGQAPFLVEMNNNLKLDNDGAEQLKRVYSSFVKLPFKVQKRLRIPMRRLNLAMRRRWEVDTAIDIGIALELLFTEQKPLDSSIGFTLRLRASRLLRHSQNKRMKLQKLIADLYRLRSSAAHSGELPNEINGIKSRELLIMGAKLTSEAIQHFIIYGEPDWDKVIFD